MAREDHWYVPGKHAHEKQHIHEHETIQVLQNHAQYGSCLLYTSDAADE